MPAWIRKWPGGRVYLDKYGIEIFVIEKRVRGGRYTVQLPPGTKDPEAELALFYRDPAGYSERNAATGAPKKDAPPAPLILDAKTIAPYLVYLKGKERHEDYRSDIEHSLTIWGEKLNGKDLRKLKIEDIEDILNTFEKNRPARATHFKSYMSWLTKREKLAPTENAARLLEVPKYSATRLRKRIGYSIEQVERFYRQLDDQRVRDCYCLGAKCGMHQSEVKRIAAGEVEVIELNQQSEIAAVLRFVHKSRQSVGRDHRQSVDAQTLAATKRLIALKSKNPPVTFPSKGRTYECAQRAARALKVPPVLVKYLRHSFTTWAKTMGREVKIATGGVSMAQIAATIGHRSMLMVKDHYDLSEIPPMIVIPIDLFHSEDPLTPKFSKLGLDAGGSDRS